MSILGVQWPSASDSRRYSDCQTKRPPHYAADPSDLHAQRARANPQWRSAHTSAAPGFIKGYFDHSRLHFLSSVKLKAELVREAQARAEVKQEQQKAFAPKIAPESPVKGKGRARDERVIMHCDFDCFFVAAGLLSRPDFRGKPVVVCHSQGNQGGTSSTSEIASASYEARVAGIKNGMSLQQARKLCPTALTMPYEFDRYKDLSLNFYTILMFYADELEAVSIDEALIEVTAAVSRLRSDAARAGSPHDPAKDFAQKIRAEVKEATGCEISVGISHNILLARLATRRAKPAGAVHITPADVPGLIATLEITDLWGFAGSHREKAREKLGSTALSELTLYNAIRGIDDALLQSDQLRKSVSAEINYGIRFQSNEEAEAFIREMGITVAERLDEAKMRGRSITLKIMEREPSAPVEAPKFMGHGHCDAFQKQTPLVGPGGRATSDPQVIGEHAWRIVASFHFDPKELRGIGIQITNLEPADRPVSINSNQQRSSFKPSEVAPQAPALHALPKICPFLSSTRSWSKNGAVAPPRSRSASVFPERKSAPSMRMQQSGLLRHGAYVNSLHRNRPANALSRPTDADLGLAPEVYALLPSAIQREQLTAARLIKNLGAIPINKPKTFLLHDSNIQASAC
ncbi:hypothetical protein B0H15DRAFT_951310 [Mycena belliarum]|uniref:DNA repair protein REV1 n=1 Tax=Mycena belliarum TaxID=1033014 RepID=A0AAD6TZR6_9AGAR|nr:hypothetical protein B0H15DRAFT_951310 [Mycena belliae]